MPQGWARFLRTHFHSQNSQSECSLFKEPYSVTTHLNNWCTNWFGWCCQYFSVVQRLHQGSLSRLPGSEPSTIRAVITMCIWQHTLLINMSVIKTTVYFYSSRADKRDMRLNFRDSQSLLMTAEVKPSDLRDFFSKWFWENGTASCCLCFRKRRVITLTTTSGLSSGKYFFKHSNKQPVLCFFSPCLISVVQ